MPARPTVGSTLPAQASGPPTGLRAGAGARRDPRQPGTDGVPGRPRRGGTGAFAGRGRGGLAGGLNRPAGQAHNPLRSPDAKALAKRAAGGAKGVAMRPRPILASGAAVLALSVVVVALEAPPAAAAGCGNGQGSPLLLGCDSNAATDDTVISGSSAGGVGFIVEQFGGGSYGVEGSAVNTGVFGAGGTYGVEGSSDTGTGVVGYTFAEGQNGVYGHAGNTGGSGVYGQNDGAGYGVAGRASGGTGTLGDSANGIGVWASSQNATALKVSGKAQFSRSGVAAVAGTAAAPKKSVRVSLPLTAKSMMTATLQKYVPGVSVVAAVPNVAGGYFTIYLNKSVTTSAGPIAWIVTEHP